MAVCEVSWASTQVWAGKVAQMGGAEEGRWLRGCHEAVRARMWVGSCGGSECADAPVVRYLWLGVATAGVAGRVDIKKKM